MRKQRKLANKQHPDAYTIARRRQGSVGVSLCVFLFTWILATLLIGELIGLFVPKGVLSPSLSSFVSSDVAQYLIALPLAMLVLRRTPAIETRKFTMSLRQFGGFFAVSVPIMYAGSYIGLVASALISGGKAENRIADVVAGGNVWETLLFVVFLAPVVEEWLFRKQIIDRLRVYGEKRAIVFSALAFALFHMNMFQFFYAFGLGLVFGYMYVRTSQLRYSVFLHMIVNFQGSVIAMWISNNMMDSNGDLIKVENLNTQEIADLAPGFMFIGLYAMFMIVMFVFGIVLLARRKRYLEFYDSPLEIRGTAGTKALYGTVGVMGFLIASVLLNLLMLFV